MLLNLRFFLLIGTLIALIGTFFTGQHYGYRIGAAKYLTLYNDTLKEKLYLERKLLITTQHQNEIASTIDTQLTTKNSRISISYKPIHDKVTAWQVNVLVPQEAITFINSGVKK